jgi:hypothetical protein
MSEGKLLLIMLAVVLAVVAIFIVPDIVYLTCPQPSLPFEREGIFGGMYYYGTRISPWAHGEQFNTYIFWMRVSDEEFYRIADKNPFYQKDGYFWIGQESTGPWRGSVPPVGHPVIIRSPTGYTSDVRIIDLITGQEFTASP